MSKKFYIENLGCAKNQVDAETMIRSLAENGWEPVPADDADMIIINTCGFIKPAKEESIQTLLSFRQVYPGKKIILAGCLSQRYGAALSGSLPEADAVFGNRFPEQIALAADDFLEGKLKTFVPEKKDEKAAEAGRYRHGSGNTASLSFPGSAYVKIAEGCSNNCTYCAIPLIRGQLQSRDGKAVLEEVKLLLESGVFEINLIAQDLASYGYDLKYDSTDLSGGKNSLAELLKKISDLRGDFWIRLLYMHPDRFDPEVAELVSSDKRILPYFDLPFQHASERILGKMGRRGSSSTYLKLLDYIRRAVDNAVIRSTFLLGFPGETKKDYEEVKSFLEKASLDWAGFFHYSREEGTAAWKMGNIVSNRLLSLKTPRRIRELESLQTEITEKKLEKYVGKEIVVLAEEEIQGEDIVLGRGYMNAPEVDGAVIIHSGRVKPGTAARYRISRRNNIDLEAHPV